MASGSGSENAMACAYPAISWLMYGASLLPYTDFWASFSIAITKTYLVWPPALVPLVPPVPAGGTGEPPVGVELGPLPPAPDGEQGPVSVNVSATAPVEVRAPWASSIWNNKAALCPHASVSPIDARATDQVAVPPVAEKVALP
jgi:hypothetical protein